MPVYRFHGPFGPDPEPVELPDEDAAWSEAVTLCGALLRDVDGKLDNDTNWSLQVHDSSGGVIIEIGVRARRRDRP
jgi:hypothetical protein